MKKTAPTYCKATALMKVDQLGSVYELRFFWYELKTEKSLYSLNDIEAIYEAMVCQYFFLVAKSYLIRPEV